MHPEVIPYDKQLLSLQNIIEQNIFFKLHTNEIHFSLKKLPPARNISKRHI